MTPDTLLHLEKEGLPFVVFSTQTGTVLAAFVEQDDADLFKDACLPPNSPWALAKAVNSKLVDIDTGEVLQ